MYELLYVFYIYIIGTLVAVLVGNFILIVSKKSLIGVDHYKFLVNFTLMSWLSIFMYLLGVLVGIANRNSGRRNEE